MVKGAETNREGKGEADCRPFTKLSLTAQYERMQREFALLQRHEDPGSISFDTSRKNMSKNRYLDILANEATLYPKSIDSTQTPSSYYINGNLIDLGLPHKFVACQAPVDKGIPDFLSIIYEKKINLVVMITKLSEGGITKANRYWPGENGASSVIIPGASELTITREPGEVYGAEQELQLTRRYLTFQRPNEPPHKLLHVQYTGWPDHGVPQSAAALEALLAIVNASPTTVPVIVHCSAGIGRTGTLIGAYGVLAHLERGTLTDTTVYDVVSTMRRQRSGMVQRVEQYFVIYITLMTRLGFDVSALVALLNNKVATAALTAAGRKSQR
ncbi:tyrosine-specific protein phosphatase [Trypanosoma rangeli]|uniref:Tyrosine-specific protein phosphatase n=1 Tax=Trypanosoma rangeli TaxID=5698 RepID=A0A422NIX8_TRYRA|nr:tyrosine-specific protein phosphatase [Trypanosoma rangeli]RNF05416.1 tyrosine-specific protein phosphatase [Trypanosoma rangeli]|eukprot:RNF05416.1 tyrosine-specific protein phosphatase [Trypanosoma rangeli]